jgi:hypothetical protein
VGDRAGADQIATVRPLTPTSRLRFAARLLVLLVLVSATAAACTDEPQDRVSDAADQGPEGENIEPFAFLDFRPPDHRNVALPTVSGRIPESEEVTIYGGKATLEGTVTFPGATVDDVAIPGGPVPATVQIERFVGGNVGAIRVPVSPSGKWEARDIMGGRYRVRAWYPDWHGQELSLPHAELLFLAEEEQRDLPLELAIDTDPPIDGDIKVYLTADPEPAPIGEEVDYIVRITRTVTNPDGTQETLPLADTDFTVAQSPNWEIVGETTKRSSGEGVAVFRAKCNGEATADHTIEIDDETHEATEHKAGQPHCTHDGGDESEPIDFPVGEQFKPPFGGPLPPGTYEATEGGASCRIRFEPWEGDDWGDAVTVRGDTFELEEPARNFETAGGTSPCTYERTE